MLSCHWCLTEVRSCLDEVFLDCCQVGEIWFRNTRDSPVFQRTIHCPKLQSMLYRDSIEDEVAETWVHRGRIRIKVTLNNTRAGTEQGPAMTGRNDEPIATVKVA